MVYDDLPIGQRKIVMRMRIGAPTPHAHGGGEGLTEHGWKQMSGKTERTFIMVKVDGVQRGLVGEIMKHFEQKGYKLVALKFLKVRLVLDVS